MRLLAAAAVLALVGAARAQCDLQQYVAVGAYYDIASPNYNQSYTAGTRCRWRATADAGAQLKLSCGVFQLPASTNCAGDRVRISLSGDDSLNDAHVYCGRGTFTLLSDANKLTMVLETLYTSTGGRFLCNITAVRSNTCLCGMKKQTRIVGGQETGVNEFPFMAGLVDSSLRRVYCGATIISTRYALTAAHCTVGRNVAQVGLLVGDHDVSVGSDTNAAALYKLLYFKVHPYYNQDAQVEKDNDIALARVDGAIKMSREVMPACLPFRWRDYDFTSAKVEVTGWGTTEFGGATSNVLMKADLYVQSPAQCSAVFGNAVSYRQMCTYTRTPRSVFGAFPSGLRISIGRVVNEVPGPCLATPSSWESCESRGNFCFTWYPTDTHLEDLESILFYNIFYYEDQNCIIILE